MSHDAPVNADPGTGGSAISHATIDQALLDTREKTLLQTAISSQALWVTVALAAICLVMGYLQPESFATPENFYNITRNFSFIGIMALGMVAVIATGGIDLSVGSIMGLVAVVCGLTLQDGNAWWIAILAGLGAGAVVGLINGILVAQVGLSSFVVTLGHAVDRALRRGGPVGQSHDLQFRSRRADLQAFRQRRSDDRPLRRARALAVLSVAHSCRPDDPVRGRAEDDGLGPLHPGDRRQRTGGPADRRPGQARQGANAMWCRAWLRRWPASSTSAGRARPSTRSAQATSSWPFRRP